MINQLEDLVKCICRIDGELMRRKLVNIVDIKIFPQNWPSTALGFDGVTGGDAYTTAFTTVVRTKKSDSDDCFFHVFFGSNYAYSVDNPTKEFWGDLHDCKMASTKKAETRY